MYNSKEFFIEVKKMKKYLVTVIVSVIVITLAVLGVVLGENKLTDNQLQTLIILGIIAAGSAVYCFVVGELAHNNSQMDKLWSILPIVYVWVVAARSGMNIRTIIYAIIVTLWGIRLTINFARKGAYKLRFWEGEEDYRWAILRKNKMFRTRISWIAFNLFFISIYQNALVLAMCLPSVAIMESTATFGAFDYIATFLAVGALTLEMVADEQQWKFHQTKKKLLADGKKLEELPAPYDLGFNTTGLWGYMRHPNYLGEQTIWLFLYIFVIEAGVATYGIFNWSLVGPCFIVLLFGGSSALGEAISSTKYPLYQYYIKQVFKYLPIRKFDRTKCE